MSGNRKKIGIEDLDSFSIDEGYRLYWNGERIKTELKLTFWQKFFGVLVALATIAAAVATVVDCVHSLTEGPTEIVVKGQDKPLEFNILKMPTPSDAGVVDPKKCKSSSFNQQNLQRC